MKDLEIMLDNHPGALAELGETLGKAGVSLEGGGVFVHEGKGIAHFLVDDAVLGRKVLLDKGVDVVKINEVLIQKLKQEVPGQLGKLTRIMAEHEVNIMVQYSDHDNQLILVVDDYEKGKLVSQNWSAGIYD